MKGGQGKRNRQERAIEMIEGQIAQHEKGVELVERVLEDKKITKTQDEIEKIRKKKLEKAKTVLENTKKNMK
jgi:hypothetical protein